MRPDIMMIGIAAAVLLSYWFGHLARRHHIPSVVLLLAAGIVARTASDFFHIDLMPQAQVIPLLGTAGLVLIVLEGALDLRLQGGRRSFLLRTFSAAGLGVALTTLSIAVAMKFLLDISWLTAFLVATPFGVISSAVAIPSAESLNGESREFVIYESSWSDIFGVMLFDALLVSSEGGAVTTHLLGGSVAIVCAGAAMALAFYWLVGHLEEQAKFLPLLFGLILVYAGAELLHLSPLPIVLILGLTLNNARLLKRFKIFDRLHSGHYDNELEKLKHLTSEATFLVRTFFFLLLGYVTDLNVFVDTRAWMFAAAIVGIILALRWTMLRVINKGKTRPLLWFAPRGLITATLFFSMPKDLLPAAFPPGALILVVLLSCVVMVVGLQFDQRRKTTRLRLVKPQPSEMLLASQDKQADSEFDVTEPNVIRPAIYRITSIKRLRRMSGSKKRRKPALRRASSVHKLPSATSIDAIPAQLQNEEEPLHRSAA